MVDSIISEDITIQDHPDINIKVGQIEVTYNTDTVFLAKPDISDNINFSNLEFLHKNNNSKQPDLEPIHTISESNNVSLTPMSAVSGTLISGISTTNIVISNVSIAPVSDVLDHQTLNTCMNNPSAAFSGTDIHSDNKAVNFSNKSVSDDVPQQISIPNPEWHAFLALHDNKEGPSEMSK